MPRAKKTSLSATDHKTLEDASVHTSSPIIAPVKTKGFFRFLVVGVVLGGISGVITAASVISLMYNTTQIPSVYVPDLLVEKNIRKDEPPYVPVGGSDDERVRDSWGEVFVQSVTGGVIRVGGAFALTSDGWFLVPSQAVTSTLPVRIYYKGSSYSLEKKQVYSAYPDVGFAKISSTSVQVTQLYTGSVADGQMVRIIDARGDVFTTRIVGAQDFVDDDTMTDEYLPPAFYGVGAYEGVAFAVSGKGELVGVSGATPTRTNATGFVPVGAIKKHLSLLAGQVQQGALGLYYSNGFAPRNRAFSTSLSNGFVVTGFYDTKNQKSPARTGGVRVGDVIISVDGTPVTGLVSLYELLAGRQQKTSVVLEVMRDAGDQNISIILG